MKVINHWEDVPDEIKEVFMELYDGQSSVFFEDAVELYNKIVCDILHQKAEKVVSIKEGEQVGRWTREDRVALVYSAMCAIVRSKIKNEPD